MERLQHFRDVVCDKFPDAKRLEVAQPVFDELVRRGCDLHDFKSIKIALVRHGMLEHMEQIWPIWHHAHRSCLRTHPEHFLTDTQRQELYDKAEALLGQRHNSYTWLLYRCLVEMDLHEQADVAFPPARREHYIKQFLRQPSSSSFGETVPPEKDV